MIASGFKTRWHEFVTVQCRGAFISFVIDYVIDLQFQCGVVTFQVLRKCVFWPLQRPIEYIFLRHQPLWWLCGQLH